MTFHRPRRQQVKVSPANGGAEGAFPRSPRSSQNASANPEASIAHYTALALNAAAAGDQVLAERHHQQAEYHRKVLRGSFD
jgi:hypothetical protein